jgi:hypothetical protein
MTAFVHFYRRLKPLLQKPEVRLRGRTYPQPLPKGKGVESAQAEFVPLQPRMHSPGKSANCGKTGRKIA